MSEGNAAGSGALGRAGAERVGIIFVHGVGEQRRFQHLNGEARNLLAALRAMEEASEGAAQVDVEIADAGASALMAEQASWFGGGKPTARILTKGLSPRPVNFHLHEVWWGDVNESYSLAKQFRFWLWGLSVWRAPQHNASSLASAGRVRPPKRAEGWKNSGTWNRVRLFAVGVVFALLGFSVGTISFLLKRIFDLEPPQLLRTMTNYISGVKLYNQGRRWGGGLLPSGDDFLDAVGEPPRVSIRRRMIRAIAQVALNPYDRWYVVAHSLGTVVAFNGLMETDWAWPGYLDEELWTELKGRDLAGPPTRPVELQSENTVPRRPNWSGVEIAYRRRIFARCRGLFTYGSPLDKFAALWPARVPVSRVKGFGPLMRWINVFDPVDPISGSLEAFSAQPEPCCPHPRNVGYPASSVLLLSHIRYLTARKSAPDMATALAKWLLGIADPPGEGNNTLGSLQFVKGDAQYKRRSALAWASWIAAFVVLALLGGVITPLLIEAAAAAGKALAAAAHDLFAH